MVLLLFLVMGSPCLAQNQDVVCNGGDGSFKAQFRNAVSVTVGATRAGELATRSCEATLSWTKDNLPVASNVAQIDVDTFGVDLGLGMPVATFQVKKSANNCCMEYEVYSLETPARLLRTIDGGDFFSGADSELDGRIEIWTHDAATFEGFERLSTGEFASAPAIVLRFEHGKLLDVSSEFQDEFDREISRIRKELDSAGLSDFKNSDGRLSPDVPLPIERLHRLRGVKARVLEIAWSYLYSGREPEAWRALAEMWPADDVARIHVEIVNARARGIRSQIDGQSNSRLDHRRKKAQIFDAVTMPRYGKPEVTPPQPIMLRHAALPGTQNEGPAQSETYLLLVIDSAGKVRSAEPAGKTQSVNRDLINAAYFWKFIPAFKDGRAVASRIRMETFPKQ